MSLTLDRRTLLKAGLGAAGAALFSKYSLAHQPAESVTATPAAKATAGSFRFVHLTDIHLQPELGGDRGMAKALAAVEALNPKPDFILSGGDQVFDVFDQDEARSRMLFDLFQKIAADNSGLKIYPAIGNHDVFGWSQKMGIPKDHVGYGKQMAMDVFGLARPYYSFDHKGWRFYILDSIQSTKDNLYEGCIDDTQLAWLESDLAAKPASLPAVIMTHIPILSVTGLNERSFSPAEGQFRIPSRMMCKNSGRLTALFAKSNVRLALSGHIHEIDRIELRGVTYICDGAVCGNWWKGEKAGYQEGFGILDLAADGSVRHEYFDYGWEAVPA